MEHHHTTTPLSTIVSIISAAISMVVAEYQAIISLTAGLVAIISGCMAIRHYYYATKRIKDGKDN